MIGLVADWARRSAERPPWTNVYGLARSILATGTAASLAFNAPATMFAPIIGLPEAPICEGIARSIGLFCIVPVSSLDVTRRLAVLVLVVVASGWRPRFTGAVHWWISFSYLASTTIRDGGDQIAAIVTLLLIPWTITDGRTWHWQSPSESDRARPRSAVIAHVCHVLIRMQVAVLYLHSAIAKFFVESWTDGTALYYWVLHPIVGAPSWLRPLAEPVMTSSVVRVLTWATLFVELALGLALVVPRRRWRFFLVVGVVFHSMIAVVIGAFSFSVAMIGLLILYLRPPEQEFTLPGWVRRGFRRKSVVS